MLDSRTNNVTASIRRRRECTGCGKRFTSYETVETVPLLVVKKDGSREPFNKHKVKAGMVKSTEKRPISIAQIDKAVDRIERKLGESLDQEVSTTRVGELILEQLKMLDPIAFIRFSAVFTHFKDVHCFLDFIRALETEFADA